MPLKSPTFAQTLAGSALMVTLSVTFKRLGPWAKARFAAISIATATPDLHIGTPPLDEKFCDVVTRSGTIMGRR
jgi:hypothetical protein